MDDVYARIVEALGRGECVALATVVRVSGSTPRDVGTKMLVYKDGHTLGTVGGGEMEARVIAEAREAIRLGASRMVSAALHDTQAGDPGICGGNVEVFVDVISAQPTLLLIGAGHVAMPVAEIADLCGFRTVVIDDRAELATAERFPAATKRMVGELLALLESVEITPETHIVIVTRGHAYDEQALRAVIRSRAAYIGMIGSRRKVQTTFEHLRAEGVEEEWIARVRSPIGLDIGAQTPAEIAVSIVAEIVLLRRGGNGQPMKLET